MDRFVDPEIDPGSGKCFGWLPVAGLRPLTANVKRPIWVGSARRLSARNGRPTDKGQLRSPGHLSGLSHSLRQVDDIEHFRQLFVVMPINAQGARTAG